MDLNSEAGPRLWVLWTSQAPGQVLGAEEGAWLAWRKKGTHHRPLASVPLGQAVLWSNVTVTEAWHMPGSNTSMSRWLSGLSWKSHVGPN